MDEIRAKALKLINNTLHEMDLPHSKETMRSLKDSIEDYCYAYFKAGIFTRDELDEFNYMAYKKESKKAKTGGINDD